MTSKRKTSLMSISNHPYLNMLLVKYLSCSPSQDCLSLICSFSLDINPHYLVLANDSHTRGFLCLQVGSGAYDSIKLIRTIDVCMKKFGLEGYYEVSPRNTSDPLTQ